MSGFTPPLTLLQMLATTTNHYDDTDLAWRQFVSDHKAYLISTATVRPITSAYFQSVMFNLPRFLRNIQYTTHCAWIVRLINNIPSDVQFTGVSSLLIPDMRTIEELYTLYISTSEPVAA